ncbi:MAG: phosphotyrosine protein phosphatase [Spirochaetota bacterium]
MRSRTAEDLYTHDERFEVKSAGVSDFAYQVINRKLIGWADYIIVMEDMHLKEIRKKFPDLYYKKRIRCLDIPDIYEYMEPSLQNEIRNKFEELYSRDIIDYQRQMMNG